MTETFSAAVAKIQAGKWKISCFSVLCVVGISCGQIMFKKAAMRMLPEANFWQNWMLNGWLVSAIFLYGVTTLAWVWILQHASLHFAYPFMGLAFLFVPLLEWLLLDEPLHASALTGGMLITAGIIVATAGNRWNP